MGKWLISLCLIVGVVLAYLYRVEIFNHSTPLSETEQYAVSQVRQGQTFGQPLIGGPFELVDQHGKIRTDRDFRGKWTLVYFGYTFCPDICPMALENLDKAMNLLGDLSKQINVVFITIDPKRDTKEVLAKYMGDYNKSFFALTGNVNQIDVAKAAFRVHGEIVDGNDKENYLMDHSSIIYIMSPRWQYVESMNHLTKPEQIVRIIKKIYSK